MDGNNGGRRKPLPLPKPRSRSSRRNSSKPVSVDGSPPANCNAASVRRSQRPSSTENRPTKPPLPPPPPPPPPPAAAAAAAASSTAAATAGSSTSMPQPPLSSASSSAVSASDAPSRSRGGRRHLDISAVPPQLSGDGPLRYTSLDNREGTESGRCIALPHPSLSAAHTKGDVVLDEADELQCVLEEVRTETGWDEEHDAGDVSSREARGMVMHSHGSGCQRDDRRPSADAETEAEPQDVAQDLQHQQHQARHSSSAFDSSRGIQQPIQRGANGSVVGSSTHQQDQRGGAPQPPPPPPPPLPPQNLLALEDTNFGMPGIVGLEHSHDSDDDDDDDGGDDDDDSGAGAGEEEQRQRSGVGSGSGGDEEEEEEDDDDDDGDAYDDDDDMWTSMRVSAALEKGSPRSTVLAAIKAGVPLRRTQKMDDSHDEHKTAAPRPRHIMDELQWRLRGRQQQEVDAASSAIDDTWHHRAEALVHALPTDTDPVTAAGLRDILNEALELEEAVGGRDAARRVQRLWPHEYLDDLEAAVTAYDAFIAAHQTLREACQSTKPLTSTHLKSAMDRTVSAHATLFTRLNSLIYFACQRVRLDEAQRQPCTHMLKETLRLALECLWSRAEQMLVSLRDPGLRSFDRRDRAAVCYRLQQTYLGYCTQFAESLDMHELLASEAYARARENSSQLFEAHRDAIVVRERAGSWDKRESVALQPPRSLPPTQGGTEPQSLVHRVQSSIQSEAPTQLRAALTDLLATSPARLQAKYQSFIQAAAGQHQLECLDLLLSWPHAPSRDQFPGRDMTWLSAAVSKGNDTAVKLMLARGLAINDVNPNSHATTLHVAARKSDFAMMACLIRHGADFTIVNRHGRTPLQVATNVFLPYTAPPPRSAAPDATGPAVPRSHYSNHHRPLHSSQHHHHHNHSNSHPGHTSHSSHYSHRQLDFARYLHSGIFSDVSLVSDDGEAFPAHRIVLCSQSEYFRAMLESEWAEATQPEVSMPGLSSATLRIALNYLYSGHAEYPLDDEELCLDLLETACILLIEPMQQELEEHLRRKLSLPNALEVYRTAYRLGSTMLVAHSCVFILTNYTQLQEEDAGQSVLYHILEDLAPSDYQHNLATLPRPFAI